MKILAFNAVFPFRVTYQSDVDSENKTVMAFVDYSHDSVVFNEPVENEDLLRQLILKKLDPHLVIDIPDVSEMSNFALSELERINSEKRGDINA